MELRDLKVKMFGYDRESVFRYIVELEEEASEKLRRQNQRAYEMENDLKRQIDELKENLKAAQKENKELLGELEAIYAGRHEEMETRIYVKEAQLMKEINENAKEQQQNLDNYAEKVQRLQRYVRTMLEDLDKKISTAVEEAEEAKEMETGMAGSLFRRKTINGSAEE